jgi:hypothetical protein
MESANIDDAGFDSAAGSELLFSDDPQAINITDTDSANSVEKITGLMVIW